MINKETVVYAFTYISSFVTMDGYAGQCLLKYNLKLLELCIVQIRKASVAALLELVVLSLSISPLF